MAISKPLIALLLVSVLVLHPAQAYHRVNTIGASANPPNQPPSSPPPKFGGFGCGWSCFFRCIASSRFNLCNRACGACCAQCNCVPPGTYGNYEACPCYASLKTHDGKPKCP